MRVRHFILDENKNAVEVSCLEQMMWVAHGDNHVRDDYIGNIHVSTILLPGPMVDHENVTLCLFETMIFGGKHNNYQCKYGTKAEAEAGHELALAMVRAEAELN